MDSIFMAKDSVKSLIEKINCNEKMANEYDQLYELLDKELFDCFCSKGYLKECEPTYCTFRYTDSCEYIRMLAYFRDVIGIDVVNKRKITL